MVSRKATCGLPTLADTVNSRIIRSTRTSRCSSPMPEIVVWPVASSVRPHDGLGLRGVPGDRRGLEWAREEVDDGIEQRLDGLVLERAAAQDRDDLARDGRGAQAALEVVCCDLLVPDVLLEDGVVVVRDDVDELVSPVLGVGLELLRDVDRLVPV